MSPHDHEELATALGKLVQVGTGELPHLYQGHMGACPDEVEGPESRDLACGACQWLIRAEQMLKEVTR